MSHKQSKRARQGRSITIPASYSATPKQELEWLTNSFQQPLTPLPAIHIVRPKKKGLRWKQGF